MQDHHSHLVSTWKLNSSQGGRIWKLGLDSFHHSDLYPSSTTSIPFDFDFCNDQNEEFGNHSFATIGCAVLAAFRVADDFFLRRIRRPEL